MFRDVLLCYNVNKPVAMVVAMREISQLKRPRKKPDSRMSRRSSEPFETEADKKAALEDFNYFLDTQDPKDLRKAAQKHGSALQANKEVRRYIELWREDVAKAIRIKHDSSYNTSLSESERIEITANASRAKKYLNAVGSLIPKEKPGRNELSSPEELQKEYEKIYKELKKYFIEISERAPDFFVERKTPSGKYIQINRIYIGWLNENDVLNDFPPIVNGEYSKIEVKKENFPGYIYDGVAYEGHESSHYDLPTYYTVTAERIIKSILLKKHGMSVHTLEKKLKIARKLK